MKDIFVLPEKPDFIDSLAEIGVKVVVVSIIGKSSYNSFGQKVRPLGKIFEFNNEQKDECRIEGSYDDERQIIYLHLYSLLDSVNLIEHYSGLVERCKEQKKNSDFLTIYNEVKSSYARALLLLFHISHIVVLSHPGNSLDFDINYIQIFKSLDSIRQKWSSQITETLRSVSGLSSEWAVHGRPCTPRLVVYFERCPRPLRRRRPRHHKLEHEIEDRIYHILRKVRLVSQTNCNSLFAIPGNQEYVYIELGDSTSDVSCDGESVGPAAGSRLSAAARLLLRGPAPAPQFPFAAPAVTPTTARHFKKFLHVHTDLAVTKGFDDCVGTGRHAHHHSAYFEVPRIDLWFAAMRALHTLFLTTSLDDSTLHTDTRFSEQRCQKVLPLALARYQDSLAAHYTRAHHLQRLALAQAVFSAQARGPLCARYADELRAKCDGHWQAGRQLCEEGSLTGNPCTLPKHEGDAHCSGVRYVAACDCGRKQGSRDDPYTVRQANHTFYQLLAADCFCGKATVDRIAFPVFQPSTAEFRAATLLSMAAAGGAAGGVGAVASVKPDADEEQRSTRSERSQDRERVVEPTAELSQGYSVAAREASDENEIVLQVPDDDADTKDKNLVRQPSTTEYLPGMLTAASPPSLLPQFPSWSLVCLGASSLYSHNLGLSDSQHPGFLPGTNFLLPWDVTVRWLDVGNTSWPVLRGRRNLGNRREHFNVKIFVGVEYECPRGHRFMLAAPDKVLRAAGGIVKETGHKVTSSDMPLYFACPCRPNKPLIAQLVRIHVVTPKAPVFVTLNPKVQPGSGAPVFVPRADPVRISQSAYWLLRLPYVYATDRETFVANRHAAEPAARLLAGMWGVAESE